MSQVDERYSVHWLPILSTAMSGRPMAKVSPTIDGRFHVTFLRCTAMRVAGVSKPLAVACISSMSVEQAREQLANREWADRD